MSDIVINPYVLAPTSFDPLTTYSPSVAWWLSDPKFTPPSEGGSLVSIPAVTASTERGSSGRLDATGGLVLTGIVGEYAFTPNTSALRITGDISLVVGLKLTDWTPVAFHSVLGMYTSGTQRCYTLGITTSGRLQLNASSDGSTAVTGTSSVAPTVSDGNWLWVKIERRKSDGRTQFFTAALSDGNIPAAGSWSALGTDATVLSGTDFFTSTTAVLEVGANSAGSASNCTGTIRRAAVYSGLHSGGSPTAVFDTGDMAALTADTPSFVEQSSNAARTYVINRADLVVSGTAPTYTASSSALNNKPAVVNITSGGMITSGSYDAQDPPCTIVGVASIDSFAAARYLWDAKTLGSRNALNAVITTGALQIVTTAGSVSSSLSFTAATSSLVAAYVNEASTYTYLNGSTSTVMSTVDSQGNASGWSIGQAYNGGARMLGKWAYVGVFPGELTTAQLANIRTWAQAQYASA